MKIKHMGDFSAVQNLINEVHLRFLEPEGLQQIGQIDSALDDVEDSFPEHGLLIEATPEELKTLGGELLDEDVEIRKPFDQEAWRIVWEAAKELWLIRSSQAMATPYPAVKEAVMPEFEKLKAALDKTEPKP